MNCSHEGGSISAHRRSRRWGGLYRSFAQRTRSDGKGVWTESDACYFRYQLLSTRASKSGLE